MSRKRDKWYQKTESMLYNYPSFGIRIRSHQAFIDEVQGYETRSGLVSFYGSKEGVSYNVSSPVEADVVKQLEIEAKYQRKIENLKRWKEIVETSIDIMLDPDQRELVDLAYWRRLPWQQVCNKKLLDKNTFFNQRRDIVKVLAWCFGYLDDDDARTVLGLFAEEELWKRKVAKK